MARVLLAFLLVIPSNAAMAHPSTVPHAHPHGASALPEFHAIVFAAVVLAFVFVLWRKFRRG
jgi:hypothetical protein